MENEVKLFGFNLLGEPREAMLQWVTTVTGVEPDSIQLMMNDTRIYKTTLQKQKYRLIFMHRTSWKSYEEIKKRFSKEGATASLYNCIICFDKSDPQSFEYVRKWYDLIPIIRKGRIQYGKSCNIERVGITGLITGSEVISQEQGRQLAKELNGLYGEFQLEDKRTIMLYIDSLIAFFTKN